MPHTPARGLPAKGVDVSCRSTLSTTGITLEAPIQLPDRKSAIRHRSGVQPLTTATMIIPTMSRANTPTTITRESVQPRGHLSPFNSASILAISCRAPACSNSFRACSSPSVNANLVDRAMAASEVAHRDPSAKVVVHFLEQSGRPSQQRDGARLRLRATL